MPRSNVGYFLFFWSTVPFDNHGNSSLQSNPASQIVFRICFGWFKTCNCLFRIMCTTRCGCVCPATETGLRTKRKWGLDEAAHGATTPPQQITGRPNYSPCPYKHTLTTWQHYCGRRSAASVCMCVLLAGRVGHLGFLQGAKQTEWGRFTSPSGQTVNIDTVCHNKRQTEPESSDPPGRKGFLKVCWTHKLNLSPCDFLIARRAFLVIGEQITEQPISTFKSDQRNKLQVWSHSFYNCMPMTPTCCFLPK